MATSQDGEKMEDLVKRADRAMYEDKRLHHTGGKTLEQKAKNASALAS